MPVSDGDDDDLKTKQTKDSDTFYGVVESVAPPDENRGYTHVLVSNNVDRWRLTLDKTGTAIRAGDEVLWDTVKVLWSPKPSRLKSIELALIRCCPLKRRT